MTAAELDQQQLSALLDKLGERLHGEWLLVGGALVSVWVEPRRVTEDDIELRLRRVQLAQSIEIEGPISGSRQRGRGP